MCGLFRCIPLVRWMARTQHAVARFVSAVDKSCGARKQSVTSGDSQLSDSHRGTGQTLVLIAFRSLPLGSLDAILLNACQQHIRA